MEKIKHYQRHENKVNENKVYISKPINNNNQMLWRLSHVAHRNLLLPNILSRFLKLSYQSCFVYIV